MDMHHPLSFMHTGTWCKCSLVTRLRIGGWVTRLAQMMDVLLLVCSYTCICHIHLGCMSYMVECSPIKVMDLLCLPMNDLALSLGPLGVGVRPA